MLVKLLMQVFGRDFAGSSRSKTSKPLCNVIGGQECSSCQVLALASEITATLKLYKRLDISIFGRKADLTLTCTADNKRGDARGGEDKDEDQR